jgi:hypothetical protein
MPPCSFLQESFYVQESHGTFVGCRGIVDRVIESVGAGGGRDARVTVGNADGGEPAVDAVVVDGECGG